MDSRKRSSSSSSSDNPAKRRAIEISNVIEEMVSNVTNASPEIQITKPMPPSSPEIQITKPIPPSPHTSQTKHPVTVEGLHYSVVINLNGSLGFTLHDNFPKSYQHQFVPIIGTITPTGAAFGCGKGVVPDGIRIGDYITNIGGVSVINTNMNRVVELVKASQRPLCITFYRSKISCISTFEQHVQKFSGKEKAQYITKFHQLEGQIIKLEEKNKVLRDNGQFLLIEKNRLKIDCKRLNDQLLKNTKSVLKGIDDDVASAVARPAQNQGLKRDLASTQERLQDVEVRLEGLRRKANEELHFLPNRFIKTIAKRMVEKMVVPIVAISHPQPVYEESLSFTVEGMREDVFKTLFKNVGRKKQKFQVLSINELENVLNINLSRLTTIKVSSDRDLQFHVAVKHNELDNSIVLRYKQNVQSLKFSFVVETREIKGVISSLGKQARFA